MTSDVTHTQTHLHSLHRHVAVYRVSCFSPLTHNPSVLTQQEIKGAHVEALGAPPRALLSLMKISAALGQLVGSFIIHRTGYTCRPTKQSAGAMAATQQEVGHFELRPHVFKSAPWRFHTSNFNVVQNNPEIVVFVSCFAAGFNCGGITLLMSY